MPSPISKRIIRLASQLAASLERTREMAPLVALIEKPEPALIRMAEAAERGEFGANSREVLKYLDDAIDHLAKARSALGHAAARMG